MGFILLIVFILTIFRTWKQSPLYGRIATRANCNSPLQRAQTYSYHAHDVFCVFTYLRTSRKHTCRGKVRELAQRSMWAIRPPTWGNWKHGRICNVSDSRKKRTQQHRAICKSPLRHTQKTSCQYQCSMINVQWSMINDQWLMINDPYSLITDLCSLFTLHFSLPSPLPLLFSFLTTILLDLYIKNVVFLHRI